ncbi:MAG: hypothetical protein J6C46_06300 [Clostridia bacterium]|nr:hypothetical protein [Clostridia bacterium]
MQIFLRILKETGIAIIVLALVALVVWLLFQKQIPFLGKSIPNAIEYAEINKADFDIEGDIESETNPTQTYEPTNAQLNGYEEGRYVSTGLPNPFSSNNAEPDVPTERVTITNSKLNASELYLSGDATNTTDDGSGKKSLE